MGGSKEDTSGRGEVRERVLVLDRRARLAEPMLALLATERNDGGRLTPAASVAITKGRHSMF
jgi:hypothetical protein